MAHRFIEHTADLAVALESATLGGLFAEALRGLTDAITDLRRVRAREERRLAAAAPDLEQLLVDGLGEAVYAFEVDGLLFCDARVEVVEGEGGFSATGRARGERFDARRHPLEVPVKGVTYHGLRVERKAGCWRARLVLDI